MNNKISFRFDMLKFVRDEALFITFRHTLYRAYYDIYDEEGKAVVSLSIIYGYAAHGNRERPFELWWSGDHESEPIGYLTKEDVEEFINGEYWKDPESFRNKIN